MCLLLVECCQSVTALAELIANSKSTRDRINALQKLWCVDQLLATVSEKNCNNALYVVKR
jgi:hypothetical protein